MTNTFPVVTAEDLRARWPDMPPGSDEHANQLLSDAGVLIRASAPRWDKLERQVIIMVSCAIVKRSIIASTFPDGASSISQTDGALYLTKAEKKLLGVGAQKAFAYDLMDGSIR